MVLSVYYQNVRGLRTKTNDIRVNSSECDYDIICLTETFLNNSVYDHEILSHEFNIVRRDRSTSSSVKHDGGGVLLGVNNKYSYEELTEWYSDAEDVWISIQLNNHSKLYICCVYIPPGDRVSMTIFLDKLLNIFQTIPDGNFLICGDFNLPFLNWEYVENNSYLSSSNTYNVASTEFIDSISYCGLRQFNSIKNLNNRTLDLILCSIKNVKVQESLFPLSKIDTQHHPPIEVVIDMDNPQTLMNKPRKMYKFRTADYVEINNSLSNIDWPDIFKGCNTEEMISIFYDNIWRVINKFVKYKLLTRRSYPHWYSYELIRLIKSKDKAHKAYKVFKTTSHYNVFSMYRKRVKSTIKICYNNYVSNIEGEIINNNKKFWSYVSSLKKSNIPLKMKFKDVTSCTGIETCNLFSEYFQSVYVVESPGGDGSVADCTPATSSNCLSTVDVNENEVLDLLTNLDVTKGAGPDGIPSIFIRNCSTSLNRPLSLIFSKSLRDGHCPTIWKKAFVVPIFKSGNKNVKNSSEA